MMPEMLENSRLESFPTGFVTKEKADMGQHHRPLFRKRSLADLPGNVRVPVFKKPDRLKSRLEASLAGLRELQTLREKHQDMVNQAKTSFQRVSVNRSVDSDRSQDWPTKMNDLVGEYGELEGVSEGLGSSLSEDGTVQTEVDKGIQSPTEPLASTIMALVEEKNDGDLTVNPLAVSKFDKSDSFIDNKIVDGNEITINICTGSDGSQAEKDTEQQVREIGGKWLPGQGMPAVGKSYRPRSKSMSYCQIVSKSQDVANKAERRTNRSSEDVLSTTSSGSRLKRKGSIFEGVDLSLRGPNPVHAILLQYGPLSTTQSMPSVCSTVSGRESSLTRITGSRLSESETSSSRDSVFSADTVTSATQTEEPFTETTTKSVGTQFGNTDESEFRKEESFEKEGKNEERRKQTKAKEIPITQCNTSVRALKCDQQTELPNACRTSTAGKNMSKKMTDVSSTTCKWSSPKSSENVQRKADILNKNIFTDSGSSPKESSGQIPRQRFNVSQQYNRNISTRPNSSLIPRANTMGSACFRRPQNKSQMSPRNFSQGCSFPGSQSMNRMTKSMSNIHLKSCKHVAVEPQYHNAPAQTITPPTASYSESSKRHDRGDLSTRNNMRRFGMPLDSKLVQNTVTKQSKHQTSETEMLNESSEQKQRSSSGSACVSTKDNLVFQGKENSRPQRPSSSSIDSEDDEYGMASLLEPFHPLTSTPLMSNKVLTTPLAKLNFVPDEGYCPSNISSNVGRHRRHHKLSIRSDHTWTSSDLEDSGVCSGELSPFYLSSPTNTRFNFELPPLEHGRESNGSRINQHQATILPEWDSFSRKSSVSLLSLSTDVQESSL